MVVKYEATMQPLKVTCAALRKGGTYVVAYDRKTAAEYVSHPAVCSRSGEVIFAKVTDPIIVPSFTVNFETPRDKKLVNFALYDFSKRPKVDRLVDFEFPLGDNVNAFAGESYCAVKSIPFRLDKYNGEVQVLLRVHPTGTPMPTMEVQQPTRTISDPTIRMLKLEKLIPETVGSIEADADIMDELALKLGLLERTTSARKQLSPEALILVERRNELETILEELEAADRADGGRSQLDSAERHMLAAIELEEATWNQKLPQSPLGGTSVNTAPSQQLLDPTKTSALLKDLETQRQALRKRLEQLERQQTVRDVTDEAIETLEAVKHLESVIEETKQHATGASTKNNSTSSASDSPRSLAQQLLHAHAMLEAAEYSVKLVEALKHVPYDGVAQALEEHAKLPIPASLSGIAKNSRRPPPGGFPPAVVPPTVVGAGSQSANAPPAAKSAAPFAFPAPNQHSTTTAAALDDLFSSRPVPVPSQGVSQPSGQPQWPAVQQAGVTATAPPASVVPATRSTGPGALLDDLFGSGPITTPPTAAVRPTASVLPPAPVVAASTVAATPAAPSRVAPVVSSSAAPSELPKFEVLTSLATSTTPVELNQVKSLKATTEAVRFVDHTGTKFVRGTRIAFHNGGNIPLTISEVVALQEDIFSSKETPIQSRCNTSMVRVANGATATLFLSFAPQAASMQNTVISLMRLKVTTDDGRQVMDSVRLKL